MVFCSPIELSLLACSRAAIRLLARTGATPAWDEGYERAAKKRLAVERVDRRTQSAAPNSLDSAPQRPQLHSRAPNRRPRRQQTLCSTRARGRTAFIDPHIIYRFLPATRTNARWCTPTVAAAKATTVEHARWRARDETAVSHAGLEKTPQHTLDRT